MCRSSRISRWTWWSAPRANPDRPGRLSTHGVYSTGVHRGKADVPEGEMSKKSRQKQQRTETQHFGALLLLPAFLGHLALGHVGLATVYASGVYPVSREAPRPVRVRARGAPPGPPRYP